MIRASYSPEGDVLSIDLTGVPTTGRITTRQLPGGIFLDFDRSGRFHGIEIHEASARYDLAWLSAIGEAIDWLSLREAEAEAHEEGEPISASQLRELLNDGKIAGEKKGRDWRIARHVLWNYLETRPTAGRPARVAETKEAPRRSGKKNKTAR